ncbi:putative EF-hand calcium-binding domain-containing protein 4A-like [Scophthalmus maximus]|uniref:Putative EF-hand calcium-binding domain-containing protein 4A-like n=1 Tax=Scophthalmus maximus TaxID=52904 RepID=A0A2U9BY66_SCOMX|nr:putative EF-hand calcium-binding domain-containing protein 4A-like [Scophthalmus maximus]
MSKWLKDGEVLEAQGSGEAVPVSPRTRGLPAGSPRPGWGHSPLASPREAAAGSQQAQTMGKAKELFLLCDKEGKGFITKRDMQTLQRELPLSPEQLDTVFESLDRESNGFLTPVEFNTGLGELVGQEDTTELSRGEAEEDTDQVDWSQEDAAIRFVNTLMELGADKLFKDQQELCSMWCELQRDRPELLSVLESVLIHTVSHLKDSIRERDSLEQALRRRESEHDQVVRSIYEEMENQLREERQKYQAQDSIRQMQRGKQLEEELKMREQELETTLTKQKELETRIRQLSSEQVNVKEQNQRLRSINIQLQEQVESSREQLQAALGQLSLLQLNAAQEQVTTQRNVMKVSRNIQKEKDSLFRQLELLRDMNKRLRDEKDAQHSQKRSRLVDPQRVFKVVFLGNSGVGKSSFIQHYCTGCFCSKMSATVGIDFQMKTLTLDSTSITLQLWDTAGQERFRSITEQYYRKADSVLAMYDVTHSPSFTAVRGWMDSVKEKMCEGAVLMLLGNKLDLVDAHGREVATGEGQRLAEIDDIKCCFVVYAAAPSFVLRMQCQERMQHGGADDSPGKVAGGAVLAVGVWTLVEKSDYISLLNSSFYSASAYILIAAGVIVIVTGIIGCCATLKEMKSLLVVYLILLLFIFLLEIIAGVLAYINYQELDEELRQNLKVTMQQKYQQPGEESVTQAVDKLQQEFKCCGSNNFSDWTESVWIQAADNKRLVPDSCCKTPSDLCGHRDHPSNIYKVEGGCIMKLEDFILSQLYILGAVGIGIAFLQGKPIEFVGVDESTARWVQDFNVKPYATPAKLESIDGARYQALLIPDCPGALNDLAHSGSLHRILSHFISHQKPVCAVGQGVSALCCATEGQKWIFKGYSLTGPSVFELVRRPDFANLPLIVEDFVKDSGGSFTASEEDAVHVVVDRHLITGQNVQSTSLAVHNLILLCGSK